MGAQDGRVRHAAPFAAAGGQAGLSDHDSSFRRANQPNSLQGWVNSYESVRFVAINDHTAVITGEYNFEQVKAWLKKYVPVKSLKIS